MVEYTVPKSLASKVMSYAAASAAAAAVGECRLIMQLLGTRQPTIVDVRLEELETAYRMRAEELRREEPSRPASGGGKP